MRQGPHLAMHPSFRPTLATTTPHKEGGLAPRRPRRRRRRQGWFRRWGLRRRGRGRRGLQLRLRGYSNYISDEDTDTDEIDDAEVCRLLKEASDAL